MALAPCLLAGAFPSRVCDRLPRKLDAGKLGIVIHCSYYTMQNRSLFQHSFSLPSALDQRSLYSQPAYTYYRVKLSHPQCPTSLSSGTSLSRRILRFANLFFPMVIQLHPPHSIPERYPHHPQPQVSPAPPFQLTAMSLPYLETSCCLNRYIRKNNGIQPCKRIRDAPQYTKSTLSDKILFLSKPLQPPDS